MTRHTVDCRLTLTNEEAYALIMDVAAGKLDSVDDIAAVPATATRPRGAR